MKDTLRLDLVRTDVMLATGDAGKTGRLLGSLSAGVSMLYAFLMERFEYKQETSITPAYSLLRHGTGDSRAFAQVYAAMCRDAGLTCMTVTGTRDGEPWTWNILLDGEEYYHVDLLRCSENGRYREQTDAEMEGYVWDYSEYPACTGSPVTAETTAPETQPTENDG